MRLPLLLLFLLTAARGAPTLKVEQAVYTLDPGVLQLVIAFTNPTDSVLFLDCQGRPKASAKGKTLLLSFGNAEDTSAEAAIPARVEPRKVFTAERKLYVKSPGRENPSVDLDPAAFADLRVEIRFYPERSEGEGTPWVKERGAIVTAKPVVAQRRGKRPPPLPVHKTRTYVPPPPAAEP